MALSAVSPSVFRCHQQLVDLARTVQAQCRCKQLKISEGFRGLGSRLGCAPCKEVARLAGQQEQERRLALIASELQTFARNEFQPDESFGRIAEPPAAPAVHVSLRDLRASDEGAWRELQKLQGQLAETRQDLKELNSCYQKRMEEQEEQVETLSSRLQSLREDQEAASRSLQDHETRLGVSEADHREAQEAAKASCQRNSSSFDEVHKVHGRLSSEVAEVRAAFETLEQEIMESYSNHKQSVQTRQQQVLEQVEELRFLSQQRHTEAQEQFEKPPTQTLRRTSQVPEPRNRVVNLLTVPRSNSRPFSSWCCPSSGRPSRL